MSKKPAVFWGSSKKELDKTDKIEDNIEVAYSESKFEEKVVKPEFTGNFQSFGILKVANKDYDLVIVDVDLNTMESQAKRLGLKLDSEARAIMELNKRLAEQSKKFR